MADTQPKRPTILWVWHDRPSLVGSGSQQRAAHVIAALREFFTVHVVLLRDGRRAPAATDAALLEPCGMSTDVADGGSLVRLKEEVSAVAMVLFDFTTAFELRRVLGSLGPLYIDLDELLSKRQERFLATPGLSPERQDELSRGFKLFVMLERQLLHQFRGVFVASVKEQRHLESLVDMRLVTVVPNATADRRRLPPATPKTPRTVLFVGTLDYFPNIDAVNYFLSEVWPLLLARYGKGVRFHIIGRHPPADFRPETVAGVTLSPCCDDLISAYREAALAVVPIRCGGGTRIKILEAFSFGRPVVSTPIGAEGLAVKPGRELLIADNPCDFAEACMQLLDSPRKAERLVEEAARFVRIHNSPEAVRKAVEGSVLVQNHAHASL